MSHPNHHFSFHKFFHKKSNTHKIDLLTYFIGVIGNIAVIPQILKAWQGRLLV